MLSARVRRGEEERGESASPDQFEDRKSTRLNSSHIL